ncbi:unnamed protein product [Amoebophrya sp. A120]|nr:unnamed protein product [Amoebophrya sp. A120]|eukprot:GSA120T00020613001.1
MKTLADKFGFVTGFSDHTKGVVCPLAAAVMGASIIEKHVTLDRSMKGTDQPGSLEEKDLLEMVQNIRMAEKAVGDGIKCVNPATAAAMHKLARSVTSKREIQKGEVIQESMLCLKSPGDGYKWVDRVRFVGKVAAQLIPSDATLRDNMILAEPEGKSGKKGDGEPQGATDSVSVGA